MNCEARCAARSRARAAGGGIGPALSGRRVGATHAPCRSCRRRDTRGRLRLRARGDTAGLPARTRGPACRCRRRGHSTRSPCRRRRTRRRRRRARCGDRFRPSGPARARARAGHSAPPPARSRRRRTRPNAPARSASSSRRPGSCTLAATSGLQRPVGCVGVGWNVGSPRSECIACRAVRRIHARDCALQVA